MAPRDDSDRLTHELAILNRTLERIDAKLDPLAQKVDTLATALVAVQTRLQVAEERILGIKADLRRVNAWLLVTLIGALAWALGRILLP